MTIKNKKIMLVEDNQGHAFLTKEMLEEKGYIVDWVQNSTEAMKLAKKGGYDVGLIDYALPDMNGIDIFRHLKQIEPIFPAIILTGAGNEEIAVEALKEGVSDYLVKTCNMSHLMALPFVIKNTIDRFIAHEQRIAAQQELTNEKRIIETIIENLTDGIIFINKHQKIVYLNKSLESIFKIEIEKIYTDAENIMLSDNINLKDVLLTNKDSLLKDDLICHFDKRVLKINKTSCSNSNNEFNGEAIIFKDITREWEYEENLKKQP